MQCTTLRKRAHTKPALNLTPVLLQTQHNCHARGLNLRKHDTSNCKRWAASHRECDTLEPTPRQWRATNGKTLCGLATLQKLQLCKLQTHVTLTTRRAKSQNWNNNDMHNPKCGKPQWFCPYDCACCETHPRKLRKITNTNHGNCKHDKTQCGDPPHKHTLATLGHLKAPTKTNHCHAWGGNSVLHKTRCCKQGCKRSCKRGCKRTMLATKHTALRHCFQQEAQHLTPPPPPQDFQSCHLLLKIFNLGETQRRLTSSEMYIFWLGLLIS